jgi:Protein containing tetrapyrrole methyltransferase domain and MazG-like (predicted pyrophosphatase) domain
VQGKAAKVGFDWHEPQGALDKLGEELNELSAAMNGGEAAHIEEELGDLLFTAVNLSRKLGIDPEEALSRATDKFQDRFALVETQASVPLKELDDAAWDKLWEQAKKESY